MQLYLFTHWFHFIEIGKKIRVHGHEFEDFMRAYRNSRNPMKDVTDGRIGSVDSFQIFTSMV